MLLLLALTACQGIGEGNSILQEESVDQEGYTAEEQAIIDANAQTLESYIPVLSEKGSGQDPAEIMLRDGIGTITTINQISERTGGYSVKVTDDKDGLYVLAFNSEGQLSTIHNGSNQVIYTHTGDEKMWFGDTFYK
ncbi:MAG: hypothetical protein LBU61_00555 [Coriobacteriales bacterium]|jgi:hypothetical protein|nr:hypothetical protein [Coriobacteriales bacterium]